MYLLVCCNVSGRLTFICEKQILWKCCYFCSLWLWLRFVIIPWRIRTLLRSIQTILWKIVIFLRFEITLTGTMVFFNRINLFHWVEVEVTIFRLISVLLREKIVSWTFLNFVQFDLKHLFFVCFDFTNYLHLALKVFWVIFLKCWYLWWIYLNLWLRCLWIIYPRINQLIQMIGQFLSCHWKFREILKILF